MKIALAQVNATVGDFAHNTDMILESTKKAVAQGADLVIFPELATCGYAPMDILDKQFFWHEQEEVIHTLQKKLPANVGVVVGGLRAPYYNTAYFFYEGKLQWQDKTLLPTYDVFDESRYFKPALKQEPIEFKGKKILLTVCEDIWEGYEVKPWKTEKDYDYLVNISASPFEAGKLNTRLELMADICKERKCTGVYVNTVGANDELIFDGRSFMVNPEGKPCVLMDGFHEDIVVWDSENKETLKEVAIANDLQDIYDALVLGIKDYFAKTGFSKAVLGLSGGIDSALVLCLAAEALGPENVTAILMPGPFSTEHSVADAKGLAENLKVPYITVPIVEPVDAVEKMMEPFFEGTERNVTEENIQARLRGLVVMAYSNKFRALALNTGNKSELAVGYCTLYGDMVGALSVIGDVYKTQVFHLARYINREKEIIPWNTISKPPSAELSPDQKDEDSLPPYEILDSILFQYLENGKSGEEIVEEQGIPKGIVNDVIHKMFISEYKRRQAAIVLKVSGKAFGSGRRIPVSNRFK